MTALIAWHVWTYAPVHAIYAEHGPSAGIHERCRVQRDSRLKQLKDSGAEAITARKDPLPTAAERKNGPGLLERSKPVATCTFDRRDNPLLSFLFRSQLDRQVRAVGVDRLSAGELRHQIHAAIVFWEGYHVANALFAADQHDQPIESERDAAVRRRAKTQRAQQMAKTAIADLPG